jgi:hypothetical protein
VDQQPPRFPGTPGEEPGAEPFPRFEPAPASPQRRQHRATGAQPYHGGGQANPWLVGLGVAAVLVAVSVITFGLFAPEDETPGTETTTPGAETTAAGSETTAAGTTATTDAAGDTSTTAGDGGALPSTSEATEIEPIGDPISVTELTMSSNDIGPLDFGDDGDEVLGRLAATFGEPDRDEGFLIGNGSFGECPGDSIRLVTWGPLLIVVQGEPGNSSFVSYRLDLAYGGLTSDARELATLSGLQVGNTVSQLESIYSGFVIEYRVDATAGVVFELRSQRGGDLLLWGPVESEDSEALVTGIYSPNSCQTS